MILKHDGKAPSVMDAVKNTTGRRLAHNEAPGVHKGYIWQCQAGRQALEGRGLPCHRDSNESILPFIRVPLRAFPNAPIIPPSFPSHTILPSSAKEPTYLYKSFKLRNRSGSSSEK